VFEREAVLGRDVESVFPTELKQEDVDTTDAVKEAIGSVKFITENEVEEIKVSASRGKYDLPQFRTP